MPRDTHQRTPRAPSEDHAEENRRSEARQAVERSDAGDNPAERENQKIGRVDEADADGKGYETERSGAV